MTNNELKPGDLIAITYALLEGGRVIRSEKWHELVVATDETHIHMLDDAGKIRHRSRRTAHEELQLGCWQLVSRGHQTSSKTVVTQA